MIQRNNLLKFFIILLGLSLISACEDESKSYLIGGNVSGLSGSGLVLQNNAGDDLDINGNGSFSFATALSYGMAVLIVFLC